MWATVGGGEVRPLLEQLFEGLSADEFHPEADLVADLLGAVDRHDVGVPDTARAAALRG
jgi:hypothetical protein